MIEATLTKRFGVREVLSAARISVSAGTVHALVGENGAGKSTLVKIIAGVLHADAGTLAIGGTTVDVARWDRIRARAAGIGIVQQHGASAGTLSVVENAVLGVEGGPILGLAATAEALKKLGDQVGLPIDPWAEAGELSVGAAQRAEIVAALHLGAKLLILDEPTSALGVKQSGVVLKRIVEARKQGLAVIFITHNPRHAYPVGNRFLILNRGQSMGSFAKEDITVDELTQLMAGGAELEALEHELQAAGAVSPGGHDA